MPSKPQRLRRPAAREGRATRRGAAFLDATPPLFEPTGCSASSATSTTRSTPRAHRTSSPSRFKGRSTRRQRATRRARASSSAGRPATRTKPRARAGSCDAGARGRIAGRFRAPSSPICWRSTRRPATERLLRRRVQFGLRRHSCQSRPSSSGRSGAGDRLPPVTPYRISDIELASRLSFFLWSSIPDEELMRAARRAAR